MTPRSQPLAPTSPASGRPPDDHRRPTRSRLLRPRGGRPSSIAAGPSPEACRRRFRKSRRAGAIHHDCRLKPSADCTDSIPMLKTAPAVCVLVTAALAAGCADGGGDSEAQSGRTGTTQVSDDSKAQASRARGPVLNCNPADANRPDRPRGEEVTGTIQPPLPRRTCTLPQRGCVAASGHQDLRLPPTPGVSIRLVTNSSIDVVYDLGSDLGECQPRRLRVTVHTTISGLPPYGADYPVSGQTGTLRIRRKRLPGSTDYGLPDMLAVSAITERGLSSESARVRLLAPKGERLSDAEARRIKARRESCRADMDDRTSCEMGGLHPVSGPVTAATAAQLARSVRDS